MCYAHVNSCIFWGALCVWAPLLQYLPFLPSSRPLSLPPSQPSGVLLQWVPPRYLPTSLLWLPLLPRARASLALLQRTRTGTWGRVPPPPETGLRTGETGGRQSQRCAPEPTTTIFPLSMYCGVLYLSLVHLFSSLRRLLETGEDSSLAT